MNIALALTFALALISFALTIFKDIGLGMIFNIDAFLIVVGGTTIALFIGFPVERIRDTVYNIISTFSKQADRNTVIKDILDIARMYRKTDVRSLEERIQEGNNGFIKMGVTLMINNHEGKEIKRIMEREMMHRRINFNFSQHLLKTIARLTPSFGLAGTVISLIRMFKHFESIETVAPMMAVALMSTLYGIVIANLFMMPLCAKLREESILTESVMSMTIEGILAVQKMEHPLKIEEKMVGYEEINGPSLQGLIKFPELNKDQLQNLLSPIKNLGRTIRELG